MTTYAAERPLLPAWRGLIGFNMMTALALGVGGWFLGAWIGGQMAIGHDYLIATDQNDVGILMGYLFGLIGWLGGLGFFNYPVSRLLGRPATVREKESGGWGRYFTLCTDHKVVGFQYFFGVGLFFFIGGLNAMLMRAEVLRRVELGSRPGRSLRLVGAHGAVLVIKTC